MGIRRIRSGGFALIQIALVVLLLGFLSAGALSMVYALDRERQAEITYRNAHYILRALSTYVQTYNRVPCPADPDRAAGPEPFGAERGSGPAGTARGACDSDSDRIGIVPFRTLGLSEDAVRDGWRNFFTYRVTSAFRAFNPSAPPGHYPRVHEKCRKKGVWVIPSRGPPPKMNVNPQQAILCCARPDPGFDVRDADGTSNVYGDGSSAPGGKYLMLHVPAPHANANADLPGVLSVVLVSHGANEFGAFLDNGTRINAGSMSAYSGSEQENADGDGIFTDTYTTRAAANYFDDIVLWRTQKMLYTELGNDYTACRKKAPHP